jgi:membrane protease YdiL (CAAX protease family)
VGIVLAWAAGINALARPSLKEEDIAVLSAAWGLGAGLAFFGIMLVLDKLPWNPLENLRDVVERALARLLRDATMLQIFALSAAAGIGEEVLFRGFLQQGVADAMRRLQFEELHAQIAAIAAASIIFGLVHAVTKTYLVAATIMGAALGYLYIAADDILAPIVAHGVYDFIAILYFVRSQRKC